jgi:hypothetical protein
LKLSPTFSMKPCPFRKLHPASIRMLRQNHRMLRVDACGPPHHRDRFRKPVQVAQAARSRELIAPPSAEHCVSPSPQLPWPTAPRGHKCSSMDVISASGT